MDVFKHIVAKDFTEIIGMEHDISGKGKEDEFKLIDAYRQTSSL